MSDAALRVLLAEDEEHLGTILDTFLSSRGLHVVRARDGRTALELLRTEHFQVALLDVVMPELDGIEVLRALADLAAPPEAIVMTGNGTTDTALAALGAGAYDYIAKPYRMAEIEMLVRRAAEKYALRQRGALQWRVVEDGGDALVGQAPAFVAAVEAARAALRAGEPLLVVGEPGAGRRTVARAVAAGTPGTGLPPFVVRCDGEAQPLRERLFGAPEGAAAPRERRDELALAADPRLGALELTAGGTLVLADAHAMAPAVARELADAVERGTTRRGGTGMPVPLRARLVATAADPAGGRHPEVGRLLCLLGARRVELPPLRDRVVDIGPLATHFLRGARAGASFEAAALAALAGYAWPGNVAELRQLVALAALRAGGDVIGTAALALPGGPEPARTALPLAEVERQQILTVLAEVGWHRGQAASRLGISPRTLYRKLRTFGVSRAPR